MHIKLTEYIRATTLTLNIKDAPMTALPLIKDAFAKLATDLEEMMGPAESETNFAKVLSAFQTRMAPNAVTDGLTWKPAASAGGIVKIDPSEYESGLYRTPEGAVLRVEPEEPPAAEKPRRGRPPKAKVEEPAPEVTPLEQAIAEVAKVEDEQSQGEIGNSAEPATTESTPTTTSVNTAATPVSDSDLQKYCVKLAQHYGGPQKVFDLAKPFVEEGAVPRPSNIKGDDKRWQFIKAVEEDSGVKYHG